ncbi:MAG: two-component regulator propeller domain-containing protein [Bacteroidota bacterium]
MLIHPSSAVLIAFSLFLVNCTAQTPSERERANATARTTAQTFTETASTDPLFFLEGQLCQHVREIYQDRSGALWLGTNVYGLLRYAQDTLVIFDEDNVNFPSGRITGILEDTEGVLWFAVENHGVYQYRNGMFTNYYQEADLPTNGILAIYRDREDRFWFGGWGGLFHLVDGKFVSVTVYGTWE